MTTELSSKIHTKLFAGCHINSEIRMHLNQSIQWKHALILTEGLQEAHYHSKDYLGLYFENKKLIINDLKLIQKKIHDQLKIYYPSLDVENATICIFPQVFIA